MKFKKIYIWYGLPVFVVLAWMLAVYLPLSSKIKVKEKDLNNIKHELHTVESNLSILLKKKTDDKMIMSSLKEYITEVPFFERFPDFIKGIIKNSNRYGVVIINFNSTFTTIDRTSKSALLTPAFDITVKGRFMDIAHFLEMLTAHKAYMAIRKADLSYDEREYPILTGRFIIEFKAWRRLPRLEAQ